MATLQSPAISIITPVFNSVSLLTRAVASVRQQTFSDWELLLVDDASTDGSFMLMTQLAQDEPRIRLLRRTRNGGPSAARNDALRQARGQTIAYLDHDDEFYPDYLEFIVRYRPRGEVLVFAYDLVEERPDHPACGTLSTWNPRLVLHQLARHNIAVPLGVAHDRDLLERVGLFDERIFIEQDWDLWKRFAHAGATFVYLSQRSGLYHVRAESLARTRIDTPASVSSQSKPRLLFGSYHCYLDPSSGAALATRDLLELLTQRGWSCGVLCGPLLDLEGGVLEQVLADQRLPIERRAGPHGESSSALYHFEREGVPGTLYTPGGSSRPAGRKEGKAFLHLFEETLERFRPDVLLSYGGVWPTPALLAHARHRGSAVVFALHNFAYTDPTLFRDVDAVLTPSRFCAEHYRRTLGLRCMALPGLCNLARSHCDNVEGRYATFVNPQPDKGLLWFARIAHELGRRRPDIALLVVEGRGRAQALAGLGLDFSGQDNLFRMANTPDPRDFYRVSRLIFMPSLWRESFGRVAVEALDNGLPVLASRRGALAETLGAAGFLFDIPERYTPECRLVPSAAEVTPWVETVLRLWDDGPFHEECRQRCLAAARHWQPEGLLPRYEEFFLRLVGTMPRLS